MGAGGNGHLAGLWGEAGAERGGVQEALPAVICRCCLWLDMEGVLEKSRDHPGGACPIVPPERAYGVRGRRGLQSLVAGGEGHQPLTPPTSQDKTPPASWLALVADPGPQAGGEGEAAGEPCSVGLNVTPQNGCGQHSVHAQRLLPPLLTPCLTWCSPQHPPPTIAQGPSAKAPFPPTQPQASPPAASLRRLGCSAASGLCTWLLLCFPVSNVNGASALRGSFLQEGEQGACLLLCVEVSIRQCPAVLPAPTPGHGLGTRSWGGNANRRAAELWRHLVVAAGTSLWRPQEHRWPLEGTLATSPVLLGLDWRLPVHLQALGGGVSRESVAKVFFSPSSLCLGGGASEGLPVNADETALSRLTI